MSETNTGRLKWVLVPAVLTLVVLLVRLWGELQGMSTEIFGVEAGGGTAPATKENPQPAPSWFGIYALIPLVGIYLAVRLRRNGGTPENRGKALLFSFLGLVVQAGAFGTMMYFLQKEQDGDPFKLVPWFTSSMYGIAAAGWIGVFIASRGWRGLIKLQLVYAFLARFPVIALTVILVRMEKGTHFEKLPPIAPAMESGMRTFYLCFAQVGFWIPLTVLVGSFFGNLIALFVPQGDGDA